MKQKRQCIYQVENKLFQEGGLEKALAVRYREEVEEGAASVF